jgi:glycosyltransferase involved in cell wall biosynthesis
MKILAQRGLTWSGLIRLLSANLRESGVRVTGRKIMAQLLRSEVSFDIERYTRWFERHGIDGASPAGDVFGAPAVAIIGALDIPQCKKYRVLQKVEYFSLRGIACEYCDYRDLSQAFSLMQLATVVIFYRLPQGPSSAALIDEALRLGLDTYYDIDDPIFDREVYQANRNLDSLSAAERDALLAQAPAYRQIMEQVGQVIVSTEGMRRLVEGSLALKSVLVWPNLIDGATRNIFEQLPPPAEGGETADVLLGYFSGSRAHDADFALIAELLQQLLERHHNLRLLIGGYAPLPPGLAGFGERVSQARFMSYAAYLESLRRVDVNLVPLLIDAFNDCKSGIRYLEASICGVPTVASRVGQFPEMIRQGETGFLCKEAGDWAQALEALIGDPDMRRRLGDSARRHVLQSQVMDSADYAHLETLVVGNS